MRVKRFIFMNKELALGRKTNEKPLANFARYFHLIFSPDVFEVTTRRLASEYHEHAAD
jgi:hypothetical protein